MKSLLLYFIIGIFYLSSIDSLASDSLFIRVHFLHGSKPKRKFRYEEDRWFGGKLGGHTGIEISKNVILNFTPKARFHLFAKRRIINSRYTTHDTVSFYRILGGDADSNKKTIITIPVTAKQKFVLDSLTKAYLGKCPYDYAFFGMRCGAAAYDVLANASILPKYSFGRTWRKTFYPRKLRRKLERKGYPVYKTKGTNRRKWEKD